MSLFNSESEMQEWLEDEIKNLHDFAELIENKDYLENPDKIARTILEKKYLNSFSETLASLYNTELISQNKNIALKKGNILKPDFILYSADKEGIVIIELKNAINATRQLGTEILAYAKEIKSYFPLISDSDIYSVIISNEWPTLLKHFIFYEIYWQNKNIICLQPIKKNRKLKLSILNVKELIQDNFMIRIPKQFLTGFQHCLYDSKSSIINHRKKIENHLEQMKSSLGIMQSEGNKLKSHGFAFLWKDNSLLSLAPYNITIINMSAFASLERFLHCENKFEELNEMLQRLINSIGDLSSVGHSRSLSRIVENSEIFLKTFCDPISEGFTDWEHLKKVMMPRATFVAFKGWGIFEEKYNELLLEKYVGGNLNIQDTDPDLGLEVIDSIIDENYEYIDF